MRRLYATSLKTTKTVTKVSKTSAKPKLKTKKAKAEAKAVKTKPVKKKAVKKVAAKPKKKPRKVLTPAEKEKAIIKKLKADALFTAPKQKPATVWMSVVAQEMSKGVSGPAGIQVAAAKYKSLSPTEIEVRKPPVCLLPLLT